MNRHLFARFKAELQPVSGVKEFIRSLTVPYCVASSSHPERIDVSLEVTCLKDYFSGNIFSSTMVKNSKPAPDLFLFAAEKMKIAANRALVIEDSPAGVEAARRAGMLYIGLTAGSHTKQPSHRKKLIDAGTNWIIDSYEKIQYIIKSFELRRSQHSSQTTLYIQRNLK